MLNDGDSLAAQIGNSMQLVTDSVRNLGKDLTSQKRSMEYHAGILNQFVENGYEVYTERLTLPRWWEKPESVFTQKIFFQRDYSSQPYLFFGVSQVKKFMIQEEAPSHDKKSVVISVALKEIMTSYFAVDIHVKLNGVIQATHAMADNAPDLYITYVLLNRRE